MYSSTWMEPQMPIPQMEPSPSRIYFSEWLPVHTGDLNKCNPPGMGVPQLTDQGFPSCVQLFMTVWTVACQAPLFMGFFKQEHWSGLLCPLPGDLPSASSPLLPPLPASIVSQQQQGLVLMGSVLLCAMVRIAASFCYHPQTWETKFHLLFSSSGT